MTSNSRNRHASQAAHITWVAFCAFAFAVAACGAAETARLSIRIVDENGDTTPARAWVEVDGRQFFNPSTPETATAYARDKSFSCDGVFTMELPAGDAVAHVEKGKEYMPVDLGFRVGAGATITRTIKLRRWIDMPSAGWFSADLHVHLGQDNPRILKQLALADDVHLVPAFTYWLRGRGEEWKAAWPDESYTKPIVIDERHLITRNNIEIERINGRAIPGGSVGATFLYNLVRPVTAKQNGEYFPTDAALCRVAQKHSPDVVLDSDKPSWAETVIGAALGALDTIQVCHNHYHRSSTISGGWGMIGPLAPGESNAAGGDGLFHRTNDLYYRLLNCGFRLGVSGGSAIGVMPVATGHHRVYAKVEQPLTAEKYWRAVKAGHSFATTGPMLSLTADGAGIGATISRESTDSQAIKVAATVRSIEKLESLQIIHNGLVTAALDLLKRDAEPVLREELKWKLQPKRSGWIAARALYRAPDGLLRQAHSSPIYVILDDKPIAFAEDAGYMLRWIQELEEIARAHPERFPTEEAKQGVLADYSEARAKYERIIEEAGR